MERIVIEHGERMADEWGGGGREGNGGRRGSEIEDVGSPQGLLQYVG